MRLIPTPRLSCAEARSLAPAFVDDELSPVTCLAVIRHAGGCPHCRQAIDDAARLKLRLRAAVRGVAAPPHLLSRVRLAGRLPLQ